jgi:hypothetical protein
MADESKSSGKLQSPPEPYFPTQTVKNVQKAPETLGPNTSRDGKVSEK